jgi:hypothetical protein
MATPAQPSAPRRRGPAATAVTHEATSSAARAATADPSGDRPFARDRHCPRRARACGGGARGRRTAAGDRAARFEDGVRLARQGGQLLDAVEQRVEMLLEGREGTVPFPGADGPGRRQTMRRTMTDFDLTAYLTDRRRPGRRRPRARAPRDRQPTTPAGSRRACSYAVLQGGKRMRPMITIAACEAAGGPSRPRCPGSCALEMIHAYSLVHDDLPAMDNDLERRGRPTVHVAFGHPQAILVGDACSPAPSRSSAAARRRLRRPHRRSDDPTRPPRRHPRHGRRSGPRHRSTARTSTPSTCSSASTRSRPGPSTPRAAPSGPCVAAAARRRSTTSRAGASSSASPSSTPTTSSTTTSRPCARRRSPASTSSSASATRSRPVRRARRAAARAGEVGRATGPTPPPPASRPTDCPQGQVRARLTARRVFSTP